MGLLPTEKTQVQNVDFFKIDEGTYDPETKVWGTDELIKHNNSRTVTIPSDIKPGMYVVRHEIIGLHFAWRENTEKKTSGAQMYPICLSKFLESTHCETGLIGYQM
jgi:cellulase